MSATILVTGGAGYIGSHACKALSRAGYTPLAYDNLVCGHLWAVQWGPFEQGDIADRGRLEEVVVHYRPIHVTDLAQAHVQALKYLEQGGDSIALNLGAGRGCSVREVIRSVQAVSGKPLSTHNAPGVPAIHLFW